VRVEISGAYELVQMGLVFGVFDPKLAGDVPSVDVAAISLEAPLSPEPFPGP
jgi:hypothetical protein